MPRIWLVIKLHVVYSTITIFDITAIAQQWHRCWNHCSVLVFFRHNGIDIRYHDQSMQGCGRAKLSWTAMKQSIMYQSLGISIGFYAWWEDLIAPDHWNDHFVWDNADYQYKLSFSIKCHLELVTTSLETSAVMRSVDNDVVAALHSKSLQGKSVVMLLKGLCTSHLYSACFFASMCIHSILLLRARSAALLLVCTHQLCMTCTSAYKWDSSCVGPGILIW